MSFTDAELEQHCRYILGQRRIKNKIVILCEGGRYDARERLSVQSYGRMEEFPDANFYNACIPSYWRQGRPQFFNCGDRQDTLSTYFKLLEIHDRESGLYYLSSDLLFALVDVDLHTSKIEDKEYGFADTEEIFHDLYLDLKIQIDKLPRHRIWVTGLMHKEAYFLNPDLQSIFDEYEIPIEYEGNPIYLNSVYQDIIKDLERDSDLKQHFVKAIERICHCKMLNLQNQQLLAESWQKLYDSSEKVETELIFALLAISKSKPYWRRVMANSPAYQREALSLQIARRFYADRDGADCDRDHLPCFFTYLYSIYQNHYNSRTSIDIHQ
jgi:hypothetical protein